MKLFCTKVLFVVALIFSYAVSASAQGKIAGKIVDKNTGEAIIGANITVKDANTGAASDLDGNYFISVPEGTYTLVIEYLGYQATELPGVLVKNGETTHLDAVISEGAEELQEVVIQGELKRETVDALLVQQKNAISNVSGISAEQFRKLPDRTTGDILRRVSGASIQDNKFAVIRGLNDRYNLAMVNGLPMPSTESDRKAFSFDLIPANLLDNMLISKTATPDMQGDFAGGIIQINTKDIPDENIQTLSIGVATNSLTTFKPGSSESSGGATFLGLSGKKDGIPDGVGSTADYSSLTFNQAAEKSKTFNNNYSYNKLNSTRPNMILQYSLGRRFTIANNPFGMLLALNYNNNIRYTSGTIDFYNTPSSTGIDGEHYTTNIYRTQTLAGGILNFSYRIGQNTKFSFKNLYNINSDGYVSNRVGNVVAVGATTDSRLLKDTGNYYSTNRMYSGQLSGEHVFENKIKIKAIVGANIINRDVPNFKKITYESNFNEDDNKYNPYTLRITPSAQNFAQNCGNYFSTLNEKSFNGTLDATFPFFALFKNELKIGTFNQKRQRDFSYRSFTYVQSSSSNLPLASSEQTFQDKNFDNHNLALLESANSNYDAKSDLNAVYAMLDNRFTDKLRLIWGLRFEHYSQVVNTVNLGLIQSKFSNNDPLPSATFIYSLNPKMNIKATYAKTVSRPEFREVAPVLFYEFNYNAIYIGNPLLTRGKIDNFDLKYEFYPSVGETFSINPFYKKFTDPIEVVLNPTSGTRTYGYTNQHGATCYGVELEARKKFLTNFSAFVNYSWIKSSVNITDPQDLTKGRPLQGQSPFVFNGGLQYVNEKLFFNASLSVNRIGNRIAFTNLKPDLVVWEKGRTIVDFQISKTFFKKLELRYILGDMLAQSLIFFNDVNSDKQFNKNSDKQVYSYKMGYTNNFSVIYRF